MSLTNKSERRTGLLTVALNQPFTESVTLSHYITYSKLSLFSLCFFSHNNSTLIFCIQIIDNNTIIYVITYYRILLFKNFIKQTTNVHAINVNIIFNVFHEYLPFYANFGKCRSNKVL